MLKRCERSFMRPNFGLSPRQVAEGLKYHPMIGYTWCAVCHVVWQGQNGIYEPGKVQFDAKPRFDPPGSIWTQVHHIIPRSEFARGCNSPFVCLWQPYMKRIAGSIERFENHSMNLLTVCESCHKEIHRRLASQEGKIFYYGHVGRLFSFSIEHLYGSYSEGEDRFCFYTPFCKVETRCKVRDWLLSSFGRDRLAASLELAPQ